MNHSGVQPVVCGGVDEDYRVLQASNIGAGYIL